MWCWASTSATIFNNPDRLKGIYYENVRRVLEKRCWEFVLRTRDDQERSLMRTESRYRRKVCHSGEMPNGSSLRQEVVLAVANIVAAYFVVRPRRTISRMVSRPLRPLTHSVHRSYYRNG